MMLRVLVFTSLVALSIAQLTSSCTSCNSNSNYGTSSQSGSSQYNTNSVQRDSTGSSSSNQPGYLPDYQGDRYTDPQRIAETQALNRAFFDSIGGAPSPPPETPAQQGMNSGGSTTSSTGSTSTTYAPTTSYGYNTQYYNPSSATSSSSTRYQNPSTTYGNTQRTQQQQPNQNFVAYDTTNQNSPYYYQRVPSTAQYNSVLGVNAGFPQYANNQNQVLRDQSNQGYTTQGNNQMYSNQGTQGNQGNQMMYNNPQNTQTTTFMYASSSQMQPQQYNNNNQQQQMGGSTQGYNNQMMYDPQQQQQQYGNQYGSTMQYGSSTPSPQYNSDSISCCSQVSSTCCYQTQQGYNNQQPSNNVQYSPSVYQYGRK